MNSLHLCSGCGRLLFKYTMSITRNIFSYLKTDLSVNLCRRQISSGLQQRAHIEVDQGEVGELGSNSVWLFVKEFVRKNLHSVIQHTIQNKQNSKDVSNIEQGLNNAKKAKKKLWKKSSKSNKKSTVEYHEISDTTPQNISQWRLKQNRPNYFIAVQVTDPKVLENALRVQNSIIQTSDVELKHLKVDIKKSHITLMAMHLADSVAVEKAIYCLDQCFPMLKEKMNFGQLCLEFEGLSEFNGGSVLFVAIKPSVALQTLHSIADIINGSMTENGILASGKEFNPHMTLMKYRWKKETKNFAKRVEKDVYSKWKDEIFGSQTISSIQLCRMMGVRQDGYYIVEHEVSFNELL